MNWHGSCYACTCTRDHNPSQFAQPFSWGIAAKAADAGPLLLASAATYHRQHGSTHERGRGVPELGMLSRASIPADGRRACIGVTEVFPRLSSLHDVVSLKLGAGFGRRPFRAEGPDGNPVLAINHTLSDCTHHRVAKGSKRHSSAPSAYGPEPRPDGDRKIGNPTQKRAS